MKKLVTCMIFLLIIVGCALQSKNVQNGLGMNEEQIVCKNKVCHIKQVDNKSLKISFLSSSFIDKTFTVGQCFKDKCELFGRVKCDSEKKCLPIGESSISKIEMSSTNKMIVSINGLKNEGMDLTVE